MTDGNRGPDRASTEVVARAQRGDVDAIGQLYDEHHEALFRYLCLRLPEASLAEDLTGEVFMRMLTALPRYRVSEVPFRAWLYRIAHNLMVDYYRSARHQAQLSLDDLHEQPDGEADPDVKVEDRLTHDRVRAALAGLDAGQRDVIALRFLGGLSIQEVAAVLERSEASVKALQHRGLAGLRQALAERSWTL